MKTKTQKINNLMNRMKILLSTEDTLTDDEIREASKLIDELNILILQKLMTGGTNEQQMG